VSRIFRSTLIVAVAGGLAAIATLLFGVDRTDLVFDAYLVFVTALVALAAARISTKAFPAPQGVVAHVLARPPRRQASPESLASIEDTVALAQADEFDLHYRLRPLLVEIAAAGATAGYGVDSVARSERAQAVLSPATWELVRPDRPRPHGTDARGIDTESLASAVGDLERILPP
jgi:hypothetical protein